MVQAVTTYQTEDGKTFTNEAEAAAHETFLARKAEIEEFVAKHFPANCTDKNGKDRANPHYGTAVKAISLWLAAPAA